MEEADATLDHAPLRRFAFWMSVSLPIVPPVIGILYQTIAGRVSEESCLNLVTIWLWMVLGAVAAYFAQLMWTRGSGGLLASALLLPCWAGASAWVFSHSGWEAGLTFAPASLIVVGLALTWSRAVARVLKLGAAMHALLFACAILLPFSLAAQPAFIYWAMCANVEDAQKLWQPAALIALSVAIWIVVALYFVKAFRQAGRMLEPVTSPPAHDSNTHSPAGR